jgi:hypothetical protein
MTSPRVIELPRRLEPVVRDTFLGSTGAGVSHIANVVPLRPRQAAGVRQRPAPQPPRAA